MTKAPSDLRVTAVLVNYRTPDLTLECLRALSRERGALGALDAIVVDGGSGDGSAEVLGGALSAPAFADWVTLLPMAFNGGFGWANNQAIRHALGRTDPPDFLYIVNPDAVPEPGALVRLVQALIDAPDAAAAGSLLVDEEGRALGSAFRFPTVRGEFLRGAGTPALGRLLRAPIPLVTAPGDRPVEADWVTGASVLMRAETLRQVGLFDEGFFLYFEEVELMHRFHRAGWRALHVPASRVVHAGGASTGVKNGASAQRALPDYWFRSRRRFFARAYGPSAARASGLAWIAGKAVWDFRCKIGLGRAHAHAPGEREALIRNGLSASDTDRRSAVAAWDSAAGRLPAWKEWE